MKVDCAHNCGRTLRYGKGLLHSTASKHEWKIEHGSAWCGFCDVAAKVRRHQARAEYQRKGRA